MKMLLKDPSITIIILQLYSQFLATEKPFNDHKGKNKQLSDVVALLTL